MAKLNCWDHKNCGRIEGGAKAAELGVCPVYTESKADGINSGKNAGRACWVVAGSLCGGKVQGTFAEKSLNCMSCDFYQIVKDEEDDDYMTSKAILNKLNE